MSSKNLNPNMLSNSLKKPKKRRKSKFSNFNTNKEDLNHISILDIELKEIKKKAILIYKNQH